MAEKTVGIDEGSPLKEEDNSSTDSGVSDDKELYIEDNKDTGNNSPTSLDSGLSNSSDSSSGSNDSQKPLLKNDKPVKDVDKDKHDINRSDVDIECQFIVTNKETRVGNVDRSFWLKIVVIFSVLDVLLLTTIFVVRYGIPSTDNPKPDQSSQIHCLECMDVYLTQDDKLDNIYDFTIDGDICCSENETLLIQKYVIKRYRSDQAQASAKRSFPKRTAIHLDLDLQDENSRNEGSNQELKWTKPSLMYGNLSLSEDRIRIKIGRTGLYYISPKVVFDDNKGDIGADGLDPMSLQLYRYRETQSVPQLLLETKETHCAHSDTKCAKPSSGQGVFKMEKGDTVVVKVTKPCGLVLSNKLNHFDMYMI